MNPCDKFLQHINDNYDRLKEQFMKFCVNKGYIWNPDIYNDTIIKCFDLIQKRGKIDDDTEKGMENYFFLSFKNNTLRESQYARNSKRTEIENLNNFIQKNEKNVETIDDKIFNDLKIDFTTLYILLKIENEFNNEICHLFALKHISRYTYKQIYKKTNDKTSRRKILDAMEYVKSNITKEEIDDAFSKFLQEQQI